MENQQNNKNTYQIAYKEDITPYKKAIRSLTRGADEEFVPPLHARNHTLQTKQLKYREPNDESSIEQYMEAMMEEEFILCRKDEALAGFLAFMPQFENEYLAGYTPSNYITTIVVAPRHRRKGITRKMYEVMINELPEPFKEPFVTTRTWSGREANTAHINLLESLNFKAVKTIENHRGPGIHTVYFARNMG